MKAKEIRRRLLDKPQTEESKPEAIEFSEILLIDYLKKLGRDCRLDDGSGKGFAALMGMARFTVPFLRPEELEGVWVNPAWLSCKFQDAAVREYLAFIAASAKRDYKNALAHGENLLKGENVLDHKEVAGYVLGGTVLAAYAVGDMAKVVELEKQYVKNANPDNVRAIIVRAAQNKQSGR
jgi:hypothetical protein